MNIKTRFNRQEKELPSVLNNQQEKQNQREKLYINKLHTSRDSKERNGIFQLTNKQEKEANCKQDYCKISLIAREWWKSEREVREAWYTKHTSEPEWLRLFTLRHFQTVHNNGK